MGSAKETVNLHWRLQAKALVEAIQRVESHSEGMVGHAEVTVLLSSHLRAFAWHDAEWYGAI